MKNGHHVNLTAGLGIGVGAGVCMGMLLAPKSGREIRQVIRNAGVEGEKYVEDRGAELRNKIQGIVKIVSLQRESLAAAMKAAKGAYCKTDLRAQPDNPQLRRYAEVTR